jgi:PAS domain S-box-containing protein
VVRVLRVILFVLLAALPGWAQAPLRIAVLAFRPKPQVEAQWQPMARYLQAALGRPVTITAYDYPGLNAAVARSEVEVVLTNPGHYIMLKQGNVMSAPLVTQVAKEGPHRLSAFGGVIFVRADDARIHSLKDLAGKRIAAAATESLGGYQMQAFELAEAGVPLPGKDRLLTVGMPHDRTVEAVLAGRADAGFVRSGVLEAMAAEGRLDLRRLRILNQQELASFPFVVSTRLHPEWPVAVLPQLDAHLADQLAIALLQVQPESEAARSAGIYGFTVPSDYRGVEQVLRRLRLPPFDRGQEISLADLWQRYAAWLIVMGVLLLALAGMSVRLGVQKRLIQQSEARSSAILNNVDAFIYLKDPAGRYLFANRRVLDLWGRRLEEVIGHGDEMFFDAEAAARIRAVDRQVLSEGRTLHVEESNTAQATGKTATYWSTKLPLHRPDGSLYALCGISTDITDRNRAEKSLKEALAFSEQIISSAQEGIVVYDTRGRLVRINTFLEALSGLSSAEVAGKLPLEVFPFLAAAPVGQEIGLALRGERSVLPPFQWEFPRTGRAGWATSVQGPLLGARGEIIGAIGVVSDISEVRRAEQQQRKLEADLQQTQKLESLGSLAGGVAHDMNNVLAAIQAIAQTLQLTHAADAGLLEALGTIEKASTRGRDLVRGLTNFARKDLKEVQVLDLNALVREEMEILRRTTLQKVDLALELDEAQPQVRGERSSLVSALMNLCVNALEAMPEGGQLTLRTRCLAADQVELSVVDSGQGMAPEVLARAMEPFYTTKPVGQGTGLGLAMVYTTAKAHGGSVAIRSEPGRGTRVILQLPLLAAGPDPAALAEAEPARSGRLRILQVDDDELILASVPLMIEAFGHRVSTATGGREALALLAGGLQADLLILDLNMPGMNGEETLREVRRLRPRLPVLLATGFLDAGTEAILQRDGLAWSIAKPFSMAELEAMFHEIAQAVG